MTVRRHSPLAAQVAERQRQREIETRHRRQRVEILGLPHCRLCGGATASVPDDEPELACVCDARRSALVARCLRRANEGALIDYAELADQVAR